jgi:hypothetical protein
MHLINLITLENMKFNEKGIIYLQNSIPIMISTLNSILYQLIFFELSSFIF